MAIVPERILAHSFPEVRHAYVERDAILYALGLGLGTDPLNEKDLDHLLETRLKVLPTMAATLASPGMWVRDPAFGIDVVKLVHSAQAATFHQPLPPKAEVVGRARVAALADRGAGRGAVLVVEREIRDAASRDLYCTLAQTLLLRGDGGYGGPPPTKEDEPARPEAAPDARIDLPTSPRSALIYRLSGDWNPLHADPAVARKAGFERPILHGLASYGMAGIALCRALGCSPQALKSLAVRFTGVVVPGDTLRFSIWQYGVATHFEACVDDRVVLGKGHATWEDNP